MNDREIAETLQARLKAIWNNPHFIGGVMCNASHTDDRRAILNFIEKGENVTVENLILLSVELDEIREKREAAKR